MIFLILSWSWFDNMPHENSFLSSQVLLLIFIDLIYCSWWKTMPGMDDDHIAYMVRHLKANKVLRELTIRSHGLGQKAGEAIADLLLHNTTLQVANLDLDQASYGFPIAKALHTNTSLKCLDVWAWGDISPKDSRTITKVFTDMLQSNHVLKFLTFQGLDWTNPLVDFYLRLNRAGRQNLLQKFEDKAHWAKVLMKQKDDSAIVYHFLSLNPYILLDNGDATNYGEEKSPSSSSFLKRKASVAQLENCKKAKQAA